MTTRFEVLGPVVVVKDAKGHHHVYGPVVLDDGQYPLGELRRLEGRGLLREVDEKGQPVERRPAAKPAAKPSPKPES